jgi:hypothetical protein
MTVQKFLGKDLNPPFFFSGVSLIVKLVFLWIECISGGKNIKEFAEIQKFTKTKNDNSPLLSHRSIQNPYYQTHIKTKK